MKLQRFLPMGGVLLTCLFVLGCTSLGDGLQQDQQDVSQELRKRMELEMPSRSQLEEENRCAQEVHRLLQSPMNEENAVRIALLNNPSVRLFYEELGVARSELVQAGLIHNPVFDANAKFFSGGTEVELGLAQPFLHLLFLPLKKRMAGFELEQAKSAMLRQVVHLVFELRRALVQVRSAQQLAWIRQSSLEASQASLALMSKLHKAGNVTDVELSAEEIRVAR